jgi:hypothetical protein
MRIENREILTDPETTVEERRFSAASVRQKQNRELQVVPYSLGDPTYASGKKNRSRSAASISHLYSTCLLS